MKIPTENELYQVRMPQYVRSKLRVLAGIQDISIQKLLENLINDEYDKKRMETSSRRSI